jgi:hypothetical protein
MTDVIKDEVNKPPQQAPEKPTFDPELVERLIKKYKMLDSQFKELTNMYNKSDEENKILIEKIKHLEKKNSENLKNLSNVGLSRIDIKKQYESEIYQLRESLTIIEKTIDEKNNENVCLRDEISEIRGYLDEERKKNEEYFLISKSKTKELEIFKISGENSSLRTKMIELENQKSKLVEENENLKSEKQETEKKLKETVDLMRNELNLKNNSYKILTTDLQNSTQVLYNTLKDHELLKYQYEKLNNEQLDQNMKFSFIEKENINLKSEVDELKKIIKRRDVELSDYDKKIKDLQNKLHDSKKEKQVFEVTYNQYMMKHTAKLIFQKEDEVYWYTVETKFNSRRYNVLDIEMYTDSSEATKLVIRFIRSNEKEEVYYSPDYRKVISSFSDFKRNAIEMSSVGVNSNTKNPLSINKARENIDNFLEF